MWNELRYDDRLLLVLSGLLPGGVLQQLRVDLVLGKLNVSERSQINWKDFNIKTT